MYVCTAGKTPPAGLGALKARSRESEALFSVPRQREVDKDSILTWTEQAGMLCAHCSELGKIQS